MLAGICYQKLKIHLSPSTLVLSIKNSFQFSKTRDMIYIVNYANSLYRLSAHRWSLSHFLFHTFAFTLSLQVVCPRWSLSLSHLHFHTFTLSHTFSHFHTFTLSVQVVCPPVVTPGEFFVCTADIPRGSGVRLYIFAKQKDWHIEHQMLKPACCWNTEYLQMAHLRLSSCWRCTMTLTGWMNQLRLGGCQHQNRSALSRPLTLPHPNPTPLRASKKAWSGLETLIKWQHMFCWI